MAVQEIVIATFARPNFLLVERATRNHGIPCVQVDLTAEAVSQHLGEVGHGVIVIDAIQYEDKALEVCRVVKAKYPSLQALVLADRSDIAAVAKAIRCGASNYFLLHTPVDELMGILAGAVANKPAVADSLFGRVWSALPSPPNKEGMCFTPSGQSQNVLDAVTQCSQLGLSPEEVAEHLRLKPEEIQEILTTRKGTQRESWLSRFGNLVPGLQASTTTSEGQFTLKPLLGVLLTLALVGAAWRLLARESPAHNLSGTVTFAGSPLKCGLIRFIPEEAGESPRPIVAGEIRDGKYRLKSAHGSDGGSYRVVISGFTGIPKQDGPVMDPLGDQLFPDVTRTTSVPCADFIFDAQCD